MKRLCMFAVVLLSVLCLATCALASEVTTPTDTECEHYRYCDGGNTCGACFVEYTGENVRHIGTLEWSYDGTNHWQQCSECYPATGEKLNEGTHNRNGVKSDDTYDWLTCDICNMVHEDSQGTHIYDCKNVGVCIICNQTDVTFSGPNHSEDYAWKYDDTTHTLYSPCCGEEYETGNHTANCDAEDTHTCLECGTKDVSSELIHGETTLQFDTDSHWNVCNKCGEQAGETVAHSYDKRTGNETECWGVCSCGVESSSRWNHVRSCVGDAVCVLCNLPYTGDSVSHFIDTENGPFIYVSDTVHELKCLDCGERAGFPSAHYGADCQSAACDACGEEYGAEDIEHTYAYEGSHGHDTNYHWYLCDACGEIALKEAHWGWCDYPDTCDRCFDESVKVSSVRHEFFDDAHDAATHDSLCNICRQNISQLSTKVSVQATCTTAGESVTTCTTCGVVKKTVIEATGHTWGEPVTVAATCAADGSKTTACTVCGEKTVETIAATGKHTWGAPVTVDATCVTAGSKTTACTVCGEKTVETIKATGEHTWGEPVTVAATCTADGSKTTACTVCGEKTVENIPATGKHTWETVNKVYATCTRAGRTERVCAVCDELSITTQGAKGHSYGLVFVTEGNGTHAKTCADCGNKYTENCTMTSTEMGDMTCSACAVCGYAVYTMSDVALETVEGATDAAAQIEVKRVENVSFEIVAEPAEEGTETEAEAEAEPAETADVILVVHETELEMTVELPEVVNANVKKVLAVNLLKEGNSIQPSSKLKLSIPVVEEEVSGMKLVLMGENGELVEIEYEIIDGVIVFETDMVGIFLFVEAEA